MEVYIEDVFLDNLIIDFLILYITNKILKTGSKNLRLLITSFVGVFFVVLNLFVNLTGVLLLFYKFLISVFMILLAFKIKSFKNFFLHLVCFLFVTAIMGGFCFFISLTFGKVLISENGVVSYQLALPVSVIIGVISIIGFLTINLFKSIKYKRLNNEFVFDVLIDNKELSISEKAFLDTGNTFLDPLTGKPVCFISFKLFQKMFKNISLATLILKKCPIELQNSHYVKVGSVGKSSDILVFEIEKLSIFQNKQITLTECNCCLGVSFAKLENKLGCSLLLNPILFSN